MIAKHIRALSNGGDRFTRLACYIAALDAPNGTPGGKLHALQIGNCKAGEGLEDLELALMEIEATRGLHEASSARPFNNRTYHLILSFHPEDPIETLDPGELAKPYVKGLGFEGHQYIAAMHKDAGNPHIHLVINRVHPETLRIHNPYRDFRVLHEVSRRLEKEYGFTVDRGMEKPSRVSLSPEARDYERHTWQHSFQRHLLEHRTAILDALQSAGNWKEAHRALNAFDATLRLRGNGLVFMHVKGKFVMKASALDRSCAKAALEGRFGPYEYPVRSPERRRKRYAYRPRPLFRHTRLPPLWRRYLLCRRRPVTALMRGATANWKIWLTGEAVKDPLAMAVLTAFRETLHTNVRGKRRRAKKSKGMSLSL